MAKTLASETSKKQQRINEQIRVSPVRVIDEQGEQLGIMSTDEAIKAAHKVNLDLVEVAPTERPPVCRIMDFGKFKYQQKKRQHKSQSHQMKIKEIRVRPKTGEHDIDTKVNHAREFLVHKNKVIVTVVFRGREMAHAEEGRRVMNGVIGKLEEVAKIEAPPVHHGRRMVCTLTPK
jgi:translation initiation factor IF-3